MIIGTNLKEILTGIKEMYQRQEEITALLLEHSKIINKLGIEQSIINSRLEDFMDDINRIIEGSYINNNDGEKKESSLS